MYGRDSIEIHTVTNSVDSNSVQFLTKLTGAEALQLLWTDRQ
jgi:hypothetical protein